jgi:hypothetical protein
MEFGLSFSLEKSGKSKARYQSSLHYAIRGGCRIVQGEAVVKFSCPIAIRN